MSSRIFFVRNPGRLRLSPDANAFLDRSRLIALDLGYEYITTVHLFLADCQPEQAASLRNFAFSSERAYQDFYEGCRMKQSDIFAGETLPLTLEAEYAIRRGMIEKHLRRAPQVTSHHILLGAAYNKDSLLRTVLRGKEEDLYTALEKYYTSKGILEIPAKRRWWQLF